MNVGCFGAWILGAMLSLNLMIPKDRNLSAIAKDQQGSLQKERRIEERALPDLNGITTPPVEIVEFASNATVFRTGQTLVSGEDWLKELKTSIRNTSDKVITHAMVSLCIPDPDNKGEIRSELCVPVAAFGDFYALTKGSPAIRIHPGETASASFSETNLNVLKMLGGTKGVRSLERLVAVVDRVLFEDLTLWSNGYMMRQHPNDPRTWVRIGMEDVYEKELELRKKRQGVNIKNDNR